MTAPPVLSSPAASRFPLLNKRSGTSPSHRHTQAHTHEHARTHTHTHTHTQHPGCTIILGKNTLNRHTQISQASSTHIPTYTPANIYTNSMHAKTDTHTQTRCPSNSFSQPFIWLHAQWLECFIFPCVWNWAAVQADTQRERERERHRETEGKRERERERERNGEGGREGEEEDQQKKQEARCLDPSTTSSLQKPYN